MFRTSISLLLLIATSAYAAIAQAKTDREKANFIGPVKSFTSSSADFIGDKIDGKGLSIKPPETVSYDETGNELENQMVSDFGEQMGRTVKKFDPKHHLLENAWVDPKGKVVRKDIYVYVDGRLSEVKTFDAKDVLREKITYSYDDRARLIEEVYYDPTRPVAKTVYKYDERSAQPLEIAFFLNDGSKATAPVGPCLGAHRIVATYDEKGRTLTNEVFEENGTLKKSQRWTYDDRSNVSTYISKSRNSSVTYVYCYEYDERGNWIKQVATGTSKEDGLDVFGKPATPYVRTTVTTRKITYF